MKMISQKRMIVTNPLGLSVFFEAGVEREVREDMVELAKEAGATPVEAVEKEEKPKPTSTRRSTAKKTEE